jgi:hypothetical protein
MRICAQDLWSLEFPAPLVCLLSQPAPPLLAQPLPSPTKKYTKSKISPRRRGWENKFSSNFFSYAICWDCSIQFNSISAYHHNNGRLLKLLNFRKKKPKNQRLLGTRLSSKSKSKVQISSNETSNLMSRSRRFLGLKIWIPWFTVSKKSQLQFHREMIFLSNKLGQNNHGSRKLCSLACSNYKRNWGE